MDIASLLRAADIALLVAGGAVLFWWIASIRTSAGSGDEFPVIRWGAPRASRLQFEHLFGLFLMFLGGVVIAQWIALRYVNESAAMLYANAAGQSFGALLCLLVLWHVAGGGLTQLWLGERRAAGQLLLTGGGLCVGLATAQMTLESTLAWLSVLAPAYQPAEHASLEALRSAAVPAWLLWCGSILIAPISEELFFRGVLQNMLVNLLGDKRWLAIVASAVVFGASHYSLPYTVPALTVLGLVLGYCYERGGGLLAPVLIHILFNLKTFIWETLLNNIPG